MVIFVCRCYQNVCVSLHNAAHNVNENVLFERMEECVRARHREKVNEIVEKPIESSVLVFYTLVIETFANASRSIVLAAIFVSLPND